VLHAAPGPSAVCGLTGFDIAILLVPVLALALPAVEAVVMGNRLLLLIGLTEIPRLMRDAERSAWRIGLLGVLRTPLGLAARAVPRADVARLVIALNALSGFAANLLLHRPGTVPGRLATGAVGVVSGLMTGYAGMPGPSVVPFFAGRLLRALPSWPRCC